MTSSCRVLAQVAADRAHCRVQKESDVAYREPRDCADFLVAQTTLELEVDDLALMARERLEKLEDPSDRPARVVLPIEVVDDGDVGLLEG